MNKNIQLAINMIASVVALVTTFLISFFFTPYLIANIGSVAYGFFKLAINFSDYALIITLVLNTMASRFITMRLCNDDMLGAKKYFSSVFISNVVLVIILIIPLILIVIFLGDLINIPSKILIDVKYLFSFIFLNLLLRTLFSVFGSAYYACNKLYISSIINIVLNILQVILLITLYYVFTPMIMYQGLVILIVGILTVASNIYFQNKLIPEMKINRKYFDFLAIKELVASGIWNSVSRLSNILLDGLDLLIANLYIGSTGMAVLAISKTIPGFINNFVATLVLTLSPHFTTLYAKNKILDLIQEIKFSMKLIGFIIITPIAGFIAVGDIFYSLWVPSQDARLLQILSVMVLISTCITGVTNVLNNIYMTTNRLKVPALILLASGICSTIIVLILLNFTSLGIWAIAGVSVVITIFRELLISPTYISRVLKIDKTIFYGLIIKIFLNLGVNTAFFIIMKTFFNLQKSWSSLITFAGIVGIFGYFISLLIIMNNEERAKICKVIIVKIQKEVTKY